MTKKESISTEEKIKIAAKKVFVAKGYAGTKTRDIAEEAGINIASLHYYYRSKDRLFEIVMQEAFLNFVNHIDDILKSKIPFEEKIRTFVSSYIDFASNNPEVPIFLFSEIHRNPEKMSAIIEDSALIDTIKHDLNKMVETGKISPVSPVQFLINMLGLTAFPFLGKPMLMLKTGLTESDFQEVLEERKKIVPDLLFKFLGLTHP